MMAGDKVGRWTLSVPSRDERSRKLWLCTCDCGEERLVREDGLKSGRSNSCGCLHREIASEVTRKSKTTHGMTGSGR